MSILVVDIGTTDVRASVVQPDGSIACLHQGEMSTSSPGAGFSEFDPANLAEAALDMAGAALHEAGHVEAVGIACQRASTIVWDRITGVPVGPGLGWQDLRTVMACLELQSQGVRLAPNQSATKLVYLLDAADPDRNRDLCFGTVDTWMAWVLSDGALHAEDATNAGVTGLVTTDASGWDERVLEVLRIPRGVLPAIVDSSGVIGRASALEGAPPIAGLVGDQQASLIGQGCIKTGDAKVTLGTGGMLDLCLGASRPEFETRGDHGTFPIVAWRQGGRTTWGVEATMLSAGTCMEWLRDDLGLIASAHECDELAGSCPDAGGIWFVPALFGLGTPEWDYGARGALLGLTRGAGRAQIARAVLEGIAHRVTDLVEAAEADTGCEIKVLRVDGGMSQSDVLMQALSDASSHQVEVSTVTEATTLGAGFLAGVAVGVWRDLPDATSTVRSRSVIEPQRQLDRAGWADARQRAFRAVPALSEVQF
jgi:glycerol kinase